MAEPATTSVTAASISTTVLFVSVLGPQAGPWVLIMVASVGGGLWPLSGETTLNYRQATMLLIRCALLAIVFTGLIASYLESAYGLPLSEWFAVVALFIGAMGNGWKSFFAGFSRLMGGAASVVFSRRSAGNSDSEGEQK